MIAAAAVAWSVVRKSLVFRVSALRGRRAPVDAVLSHADLLIASQALNVLDGDDEMATALFPPAGPEAADVERMAAFFARRGVATPLTRLLTIAYGIGVVHGLRWRQRDHSTEVTR